MYVIAQRYPIPRASKRLNAHMHTNLYAYRHAYTYTSHAHTQVNCGGKGTPTSSPCTSPFQTISTSTLTNTKKTPYCLTWSNTSSILQTSLCYPSSNPSTNRDPSQWWDVVTDDATVHPYGRPDLCLTNDKFNGKNDTFLEYTTALLPCDGRIQQHWGYGGNGHGLIYGSCASLGLI